MIGSVFGRYSICFAVFFCVGCHGVGKTVDISTISNDDVRWSLGYVGAIPQLKNHTDTLNQRSFHVNELNELCDLLDDRERFAAAHLILAERFDGDSTYTSKVYDGLKITSFNETDDTAEYDLGERSKLKLMWRERIRQGKVVAHPRELRTFTAENEN